MYIGGAFPRSESERYYSLKDKNGNQIANICRASRKDFRNSVVAARKAQSGWASRTAYNRSQILYRIAEMMEGRASQLAEELVLEGLSSKKAVEEVNEAIDRVVYFAGWCDKFQQIFSTVNPVAGSYFNFSVPKPTGVVSVIMPEKSSLLGLLQLILPAIAGGNSVIVLLPQNNPLAGLTFAEILHTSDMPGGVINILSGFREELLEQFASHMDVNAVIYGGSDTESLKLIQEQASKNVKHVVVETSNNFFDESFKNPYCILDLQEIKTTWHPVGI